MSQKDGDPWQEKGRKKQEKNLSETTRNSIRKFSIYRSTFLQVLSNNIDLQAVREISLDFCTRNCSFGQINLSKGLN